MVKGKNQFIGTAGQYYVAYELSKRNVHASLTLGNAPFVDIIAAKNDGSGSISIQVKTSSNAYRRKRYGREGCEWDVGAGVIGKSSPSLWYAFVDLEMGKDKGPSVYIVPSLWVAEFVKPSFTRKLYFLPSTAWDLTKEKWENIVNCLNGDSGIAKFSRSWPEDKLVRWGKPDA